MERNDHEVRCAGIYCRVSTDEQHKLGKSLENQEALLRRWISSRFPRATIRLYAEVASARRTARAEYVRMMRDAKYRAIDVVAAVELSRLWRNAHDAIHETTRLRDYGVALAIPGMGVDTTTAFGALAMSLFAILAQFESDTISERTARGLAELKAQGKKGPGRRPYGWDVTESGKLVRNEEEQHAIDLVQAWRARGRSWRQCAEELNSLGIKTGEGKAWDRGGLRLVVRSVEDRRAACLRSETGS